MSLSSRGISANRARHTLAALGFASLVCSGMLVVRILFTGNLRFSGLFGNLLLAWIPMVLSMCLWWMPRGGRRWPFWSVGTIWLLFFPNAFYLVTDLIHMKKFGQDQVFRWFDMMLTMSFAAAGMFLACFSLYLTHLLVRERFGWRAGWRFASGILALGSFGIYLGRALRLNSWDVVADPLKIVRKIASLAAPGSAMETGAFSLAFFFFSLAVYAVMVSFARLHEQPQPEESAMSRPGAGLDHGQTDLAGPESDGRPATFIASPPPASGGPSQRISK